MQRQNIESPSNAKASKHLIHVGLTWYRAKAIADVHVPFDVG